MQLTFDFRSTARRVYRDPVHVLIARDISEVLPALHAVDAGTRNGLFAAGYISYEAAPAFDPAFVVRSGNRLPLLCFGLFRSFEECAPASANADAHLDAWTLSTTRPDFDAAIDRIRCAIAEGRTYQVNYSTRFRSRLHNASDESVYALYERLRAAQGSGYHALLAFDRHRIVSASPELFFERHGRRITARPMKGTRARGRWLEEDERFASELAGSEKDRAENLMIVDLLRNDMGRIAGTGSVRVPQLFTTERYRTVHQLTSTIDAEVPAGIDLPAIFAALFPCGSVTGAPKISTMELIASLEDTPREVYCGAIGFVDPGGNCTFSVPIRTLWLDLESGECTYGSGAGITFDSSATREYEEVIAKAAVLNERWPAFELFETMRVENGAICRRARHVRRLLSSARYFDFCFDERRIDAALDRAIAGLDAGTHRLRLFLDESGGVRTQADSFESTAGERIVAIADTRVDSRDRFLYHKTTNRRIHEDALLRHPDVFDVILRNERDEITEFTRGNIVVELDGRLVTPPRSSGLLAGTLRDELLETGVIRETVLTAAHLRAAERVWLINSLRGWVPVRLAVVRTPHDPIPA